MPQLATFFINLIRIIDTVVVPLIFSVAFIVFIWGVFRYFIAGAGDEEKRKEGRNFITWGLIGFFLMFAVWGIVNLLINSLGFDTRTRPVLPLFGGGGSGAGAGQYSQAYNQTGQLAGQGDTVNYNGQLVHSQGACSFLNLYQCPDTYQCRQGTCIQIGN